MKVAILLPLLSSNCLASTDYKWMIKYGECNENKHRTSAWRCHPATHHYQELPPLPAPPPANLHSISTLLSYCLLPEGRPTSLYASKTTTSILRYYIILFIIKCRITTALQLCFGWSVETTAYLQYTRARQICLNFDVYVYVKQYLKTNRNMKIQCK